MTYKTRFQYLFDKARDIAQAQAVLNPADPRLPPLFFVTDPKRTPHPEDIAAHLPAGCGVIYRSFGEGHAVQRARLLRKIADDDGLVLLIGDDEDLAREVGADGVHLPERHMDRAPALAEDFLVTVACHSPDAIGRRDIHAAHAVLVSPVFASRSASAAGVEPLGVKGVRALVAASPVPVYGLGGISCDTIGMLKDSGLSGVAAVDAFSLSD
ncbi:thiamine phosphate synthase [Asticcacaulis solisilvae]|uniref:thiamine phosphate synthase n=1 Tax=Asticcacaulis solisilvae TaxID=1217274 RepID=UPI003FD7131D